MIFLKQVFNLWRIRQNPSVYDKGVLLHLSVNPKDRREVKEWHEAKIITGTECDQ